MPASVDAIGGDEIRDARPQVNLSQALAAVPGILARNRQSYAPDLQMSSRGFGALGVRLLVDGIPLRLPAR